ncbi:MAG: hypothetical protein AAGL08_20140 [Cyanobacteria bacterium J06573_11]
MTLTASVSGVSPKSAWAQSALPLCPPPAAQEYLLLVRGESEAERAEIAATLPVESSVLICQYTDEILVRAGGFTSLETANAWATYLKTEKGFDSFVSQASASPVVDNGNSTGEALAYQPRLLGPGYAVLVDYGSRPEVAEAVSQLTSSVGVAVYQQRAYLLAGYTSDAASASEMLQRLSNARLAAVVVNAEQVVQLSAEIVR